MAMQCTTEQSSTVQRRTDIRTKQDSTGADRGRGRVKKHSTVRTCTWADHRRREDRNTDTGTIA